MNTKPNLNRLATSALLMLMMSATFTACGPRNVNVSVNRPAINISAWPTSYRPVKLPVDSSGNGKADLKQCVAINDLNSDKLGRAEWWYENKIRKPLANPVQSKKSKSTKAVGL